MLQISNLHATTADRMILTGTVRHAELVFASTPETSAPETKWTLNQVQDVGEGA